ncbi:MAG: hypothetical protein WC444_01820 [Candidatus Paceibacterota bacterium]
MKTYISLLLVVVSLAAIVFGSYYYMKKHTARAPKNQVVSTVNMKTVTGKVVRTFEGDNQIEYSFSIPEVATTTISMDGALIRVVDGSNIIANIYFSYEGGRGLTPLMYINKFIAPQISVINTTGTTTIGSYEWQVAESAGSEWHIARVLDNQWLVVVESKKTVHDDAIKILESATMK